MKRAILIIASRLQTVRKIFSHLLQAAPWESVALGALIFLQSLIPALSLFAIGMLMNGLTQDTPFPVSEVLIWGGALFVSTICCSLTSISRIRLNEKILSYCNVGLMRKANSFDGLEPFEDPEIYDEMQFLIEEAKRKPLNFVYILVGILQGIFSIFSTGLVLSMVDVYLPFMMLIAAAPHAYATLRFEKKAWDHYLFRSREARKMAWYSSLTMNQKTAKEIRLFGFGDYLVDQYLNLSKKFIKIFKREIKTESLLSFTFSTLSAAGNLGILVWLVVSARGNRVAVGSVVMALQAFSLLNTYLSLLMQDVSLFAQTFWFFDRFDTFLQKPSAVLAQGAKKMVSSNFEKVTFENVSFSYPSGGKVLDQINLEIKMGQKIAIVGENGAGKTTLIKLLLRFYDPTEGRIAVDGVDLKELDVDHWRRQISALFQDFCKYHFTIKENVTLGSLDCIGGDAHLQEALQKSGLAKTVQGLPRGANTLLGKEFGGVSLSGGEWQKVAIARTFFRDTQLVVFDEPSSALDPKSESELFQKVIAQSKGQAVVLITHRLGSVTIADKIYVLKGGELVETGSHEELMSHGNVYAELFTMQAKRYQVAVPSAEAINLVAIGR